jgi:hypothetical protein
MTTLTVGRKKFNSGPPRMREFLAGDLCRFFGTLLLISLSEGRRLRGPRPMAEPI